MSFSTTKSTLKVVLLSSALLVSSQLYAEETVVPPANQANPNASGTLVTPPKKDKGHRKKHKGHRKKHKGHKHPGSTLSPEEKAEKTVENCKKLLAAPVPENESLKKAKKRKRCEDLISKEGIAITAADATSTNAPESNQAAVPAVVTAPASEPATVTAPASEPATVVPAEALPPAQEVTATGEAPAT